MKNNESWNHYYWAVPSLLFIGSLSGCALVDSAEQTFRGSSLASEFTQLDANADGVLDESEAEQWQGLSANFDALDSDQSDGISERELNAALVYVSEVALDEIDINRDGVLSEREAEVASRSVGELFDTIDADQDENISEMEYAAARINVLGGSRFSDFDADGDGVISSDEVIDVPFIYGRFDMLDIDGDGAISEREYQYAQR